MKRVLVLFSLVSLLTVVGQSTLGHTSNKALAASASDWKPGRIVDDVLFTDKNAMNVSQIQSFLDSMVGTGGYDSLPGKCDVNGDRKALPYSSALRRDYAASISKPGKFTCLNIYYEVPKTQPGPGIPASNYGGTAIPQGARSAAQLIWDAAQRYNISPKVLLVTIQKESAGPLTTDDWPFQSQYTYAMGAHCPDGPNGAECDPNYAGFSIQISESAALFRYYLDNMGQAWWPYAQPGRVNNVLYNVSTRKDTCGWKSIFIESAATAALYTYTPYTPNQAALNNLYGSVPGDPNDSSNLDAYCATYGNRNFWRIYTDWFGSTNAINGNIQLSKGLQITAPSNPSVNDIVTASYEIQNTANYDDFVGGVGVCARINGQYYDFGFIDKQYIAANSKTVITFQKKLDTAGSLYVFICSYHPVIGWASAYYPYDPTGSLSRSSTLNILDNPLITTGISLSPANPGIGQPVTATMTIRNTSAGSLNIGSMVIAGRDPGGKNADFGIVNDVIIPANGTYTYSQSRTFSTPGSYSFFIANWNGIWNTGYPRSADGSIQRQITLPVLDSPLITAGIVLTPATPAANQSVTAKITFRNTTNTPLNLGSVVVAARNSQGSNFDFPIVDDVIIPANGTVDYIQSRSFPASGTYTLFFARWQNVWSRDFPKSLDSTVQRQLTLTIN